MAESGFKFPKLVQKRLCSRKSKSIFCEDVTKRFNFYKKHLILHCRPPGRVHRTL